MPVNSNSEICYQILPAPSEHHYFSVTLVIPADVAKQSPEGLLLTLPAWLPGSYMIRDFARHIVTFEAMSEEGTLSYSRPDKSTWRLSPSETDIRVNYTVYANDLSVRTAWLDSEFGFFNPSAVCLEVSGASHLPHVINIDSDNWDIATGMPLKNTENGQTKYVAENYETLIEYPFLLGDLTVIEFAANGIPHQLVLAGKHFADKKRLASDLQAICEQQHQLFEDIPFESYKFLTMVTGDGFGGLEHLNSTALLTSRHSLEPGNSKRPTDEYLTFLSLCSHEYFHSWNVKRLKPREFIPYDLSQEVYTEQLWFYEGMTSYYDDLMVFRAGIMNQDEYLTRVGQTLTRALSGKGPTRQSVTESSQLTWTTFYQQNENARNAISSYYSKGAIIALCLDLLLIQEKQSLDNVMHYLWRTYGNNHQGTTPEILASTFAKFGGQAAEKFLEQSLHTANELPVAMLLEQFGIEVKRLPPDSVTMQPVTKMPALPEVSLGAALKPSGDFMSVVRVSEDSAAAQAGLTANDQLLAIDHLKATPDNVRRAFARYQPGHSVLIHYLREDRLIEAVLTWDAPTQEAFHLQVVEQQQADRWLSIASRN